MARPFKPIFCYMQFSFFFGMPLLMPFAICSFVTQFKRERRPMTIQVLHHRPLATQCAKGGPLYMILNPKIPTKHWENKDNKVKSRGSRRCYHHNLRVKLVDQRSTIFTKLAWGRMWLTLIVKMPRRLFRWHGGEGWGRMESQSRPTRNLGFGQKIQHLSKWFKMLLWSPI